MKAAPFGYARARDAAHAVELLAATEGYAKVVAGGQSLGPMLNLRLVEPDFLVDVRTCPDLRRCRDDGEAILFGAAVTHSEIEDGAVPDPCHGWLAAAARRIAYRAVRTAAPSEAASHTPILPRTGSSVLLLLGAEVIVLGPEGMRTTALAQFVAGPFLTTLGEDEVLCAIRVARRSSRVRYGYRKTAIRIGEFASAFCVAIDDPERGESRAVLGAIERTPIAVEDLSAVSDTAGAEAFIDAHVPGLDAATVRLHAVTLRRAVRDLDGTRRPA